MADEDDLDTVRHRRRNLILVLIGLLVVAVAIWYFVGQSSSKSRTGRGRPSVTVGTAKAVAKDMPVTISVIGTVQPIVTATVRPQLSGVLFSIHFTEGQMVQKGQLLAQIDPRPYRLALSQAEANVAKDQAQLVAARLDLQRYQTLLKQDSIARQQVDTQVATVGQLEGTVAADKAAVGTAKLNLAYTSIVAPVSGRVGLRQADIGNYLTPSDTNGIVVITETTPIDVNFALPQDKLTDVQGRLGHGASLAVTAFDQAGSTKLADGQFLTLDNQIDTSTGTVKAKARFANPANTLFPNQFVNVTLLVDTLKQAVTVPIGAVRHGAQGDFTFILQPDRTVKLSVVKLGPSNGPDVAILSGVKPGDTVITEGADSLDDGSKVTLPGDKPHDGSGEPGKGSAGKKRHHRQDSGNAQ